MSNQADSDGVKNFEFFITTQADHDVSSTKSTRISEVRSYLATRGHDHRRRSLQARKFQELLHQQNSSNSVNRTDSPVKRPLRPKSKPKVSSASCNSSNLSACGTSPYESASPSEPTHVSSRVNNSPTLGSQDTTKSKIHNHTMVDHRESQDELLPHYDYSSPTRDPFELRAAFDDLPESTSLNTTESSSSTDDSTRRSTPTSTASSDGEDFTITEIQATLDPFVQLPVDISLEERSLIHFYLLVGRHSLLGTSSTPKCCPALDIARNIIPVCPIYTLSHIVIAESLFSRLTQRPVRKHYYHRYSQMYRLLNELLSDQRAGTYHKLWALIQVSMVEATVKRFDLQALHTTAMDDFLESQGDITTCYIQEDDDVFAYLASRLYAGQLARTSVPITDKHRLAIIQRRFMRNMKDVCRWVVSLDRRTTASGSLVSEEYDHSDNELDWLSTYFDQLELQQLFADTESACRHRSEEALVSSLSLLLTFVEWNFRPITARSFLASVQANILGSVECSSGENKTKLPSVHPTVVAYNISYMRAHWFPDPGYRREMKISQAITDAKQIFAILYPETATTVVTWLVRTVKIVSQINSNGVQGELKLSIFNNDQLLALELEIEEAWKRQRQSGEI